MEFIPDCPYCQAPMPPDASECPRCMLSFPRTCSLMGAAPRIAPWVSDTAGILTSRELRRLTKHMQGLVKRFPQLVPQVVVHRFAADYPFTTHAFWLFNSANLAGLGRRGCDNHALLITLDPQRGEAAMVAGYGLEAFLGEDARLRLLGHAAEHWRNGLWCDGLLGLLDALDAALETTATAAHPEAFQKGEY